MTSSTGTVRVEKVVTSGTFSLDGGTWDVDNNVWLLGDDDDVLVIDAAHDAEAIKAAIGARRVNAILCTHGHNDHIDAAPALAELTGAPDLAAPGGRRALGHGPPGPAARCANCTPGQVLTIAGVDVEVLHTPGHSPGAVCFSVPALGVLFSGDTLFAGGPGATGRSFSDFPTIIDSISHRLLNLPPETVVHTGHGDDTTIADEAPHLDEWVVRGH